MCYNPFVKFYHPWMSAFIRRCIWPASSPDFRPTGINSIGWGRSIHRITPLIEIYMHTPFSQTICNVAWLHHSSRFPGKILGYGRRWSNICAVFVYIFTISDTTTFLLLSTREVVLARSHMATNPDAISPKNQMPAKGDVVGGILGFGNLNGIVEPNKGCKTRTCMGIRKRLSCSFWGK